MHTALRLFASSLAVSALALAFPACSSDDSKDADHGADHEHEFCDLPKSCQEIVMACHPKDDGTEGEIHDCHETGHDDGTQAACDKIHDDCIATCNAAPVLEGGTEEELNMDCSDGGGAMDAGGGAMDAGMKD